MDNPKFFQAFLNGVVRNVFLGDESITAEFLKTEIFSADPVSVDGSLPPLNFPSTTSNSSPPYYIPY
jgi:hypothetical protein